MSSDFFWAVTTTSSICAKAGAASADESSKALIRVTDRPVRAERVADISRAPHCTRLNGGVSRYLPSPDEEGIWLFFQGKVWMRQIAPARRLSADRFFQRHLIPDLCPECHTISPGIGGKAKIPVFLNVADQAAGKWGIG
jgi:hypothetical protein